MLIVAFFRMVINKKLFRRSSVKYQTFSEDPTWSDLFFLCSWKLKNCRKLFKNCSIHDKNCEFSGPYNFWTPVKSNIPDFWNWNFWTLFGSEIEVGGGGRGMAPLAPPSPNGYMPVWCLVPFQKGFTKHTRDFFPFS